MQSKQGPSMLTACKHALTGALFFAVLIAAYLFLRHKGNVDALAANADLIAVAAGLGGLAAALGGRFLLRQPAPNAVPAKVPEQKAIPRPRQKPSKPSPSGKMAALLSTRGKWLKASPRLQKLLERDARNLRRGSFWKVVHPEDISVVDRAFQDALADGKATRATFRIITNFHATTEHAATDNSTALLTSFDAAQVRHVSMRVRSFTTNGGRRALRCVFRNVTRPVLAEQALGQSRVEVSMVNDRLRRLHQDMDRLKESYRDLYHNAPVMYFSLDTEGRLVTFNDTLVRTLGFERDELAGRPYVELLAPPAAAAWEKEVHLAQASFPAQALLKKPEMETLWRTRDGAVLDVWIRSAPVLDEHGRLARLRSAALDLTERNRLAHELRSRGDELERTNARLRHINAELEDFTHVVSHDLKEPLRTLQAYSNVLAEDFSGQLGPDGFQYINHLIQASGRLGNLIDDLLTLSQAGRIKNAPQVFNLIEAVATARNDLVGLIQRKEATVLTEGSLPTVRGDQYRITQLLTNLIANALKYNNNRAPQVVIGQVTDGVPPGAPPDLNPRHAIIFVRDNGIGIDPLYHGKIFGVFRRLHQPEEYEGTGAGLAICQKIVEAHEGQIWVESALGKGATFYFTLERPMVAKPAPRPANGAPAKKTAPRLTQLSEKPPAPVQNGDVAAGRRVLLVEDMVDVAQFIQRLGQKAGLDVVHFVTAEDAWRYLKDHQPALLLLDINLPGMSGIELCKKVRHELRRTAVPIVLFSSEQNPDVLQQLRAAGASHILSKDLLSEPARWQKKVEEILG